MGDGDEQLGIAYAQLPGPDRAANLQEAIRCWEQALAVYESEGFIEHAAVIRRAIERGQKELAVLATRR